jgi:hypothetical protein
MNISSAEAARRRVSETASPQLRTIVEGMRDTALDVAGKSGNDWETLTIEWHTGETRALISNLGRGAIDLTLHTRSDSSNGVHGTSLFKVSLRDDEPSQAYEAWGTEWLVPLPGSNSGYREGDTVVTQLNTEVSRFIGPITIASATVTVS